MRWDRDICWWLTHTDALTHGGSPFQVWFWMGVGIFLWFLLDDVSGWDVNGKLKMKCVFAVYFGMTFSCEHWARRISPHVCSRRGGPNHSDVQPYKSGYRKNIQSIGYHNGYVDNFCLLFVTRPCCCTTSPGASWNCAENVRPGSEGFHFDKKMWRLRFPHQGNRDNQANPENSSKSWWWLFAARPW